MGRPEAPDATPFPNPPPILLVMGVSGSGKTTVGSLLAGRLGWEYADADDFHSVANLSKMAAGHPLTDADRGPWLAAIGAWIDAAGAAGRSAVVTCSALKRAYRDALRAGRPQVRLIYLAADPAIVQARMVARTGHFFPPQLLASQFHDLQPPTPDENAVWVPVEAPAMTVVEELIRAEGLVAVERAHDAEVAAHAAGVAAGKSAAEAVGAGPGTASGPAPSPAPRPASGPEAEPDQPDDPDEDWD